MRYILINWMVLFFFAASYAQTVETVAGPIPRINNGLVVHHSGDVYVSDLFGSGFNGSRVYKITPDGESMLYASSLSQPAGLAFSPSGLLFVAEFTSGQISTIDTEGNVNQFVGGLNQPADIVFDNEQNLYVTNYGNGTISKITQSGTISTLVAGLSQPVGLAIDSNYEYLYSANLNDGKIHQIDLDGNMNLLTTISDLPIGFMTFSSEYLYVCSTGGHKVYRVDLSGNTDVFAGTGMAGTTNGNLDVAQFTNPDGIAVSPTGDTLYISENNTNLLRRIVLGDISLATKETSTPDHQDDIKIYPNPATTQLNLELSKPISGIVNCHIYNQDKQLMATQNIEIRKGRGLVQIDHLHAGGYIIVIYHNYKLHYSRFIIF